MIETSVRVRLRHGAWYGDRPLDLDFPPGWVVELHRLTTPPPLTEGEVAHALECPTGQQPLRHLARGKRRPLVIVDDLTRPTPSYLLMPRVLRQLEDAGTPASEVRILFANGAHAPAPLESVARKVGPEAAQVCRLISHDARRDCVRVGQTAWGTPVQVHREVAQSDLLIGIGGVYPQHSVGFGGGSKLVLGVLGRRSIVSLHYGHPSVGGSYEVRNDFRRDLDEIARLVGLRTLISVHVDDHRRPVRIVAGDPLASFEKSVEFSRACYRAPLPGDADVVVANAYPMDISLTFSRSKGLTPLAHAAPSASRVLVAACPEGLGYHSLFPFVNGPRFERQRHLARRLSVTRAAAIPGGLVRRGVRLLPTMGRPPGAGGAAQAYAGQVRRAANPVLLWTPGVREGALPVELPGMRRVGSWAEVVERVRVEQAGRRSLKVAVYPCAPLQCLELGGKGAP